MTTSPRKRFTSPEARTTAFMTSNYCSRIMGTRPPLGASNQQSDPRGLAMRKTVLGVVVITAAVLAIGGQAAWGCGGLVAPNGAVRLLKTTTLAAYHDGVEHYLTSFQFAGGGNKFGSIIPLPGVPSSVSKGGSWTLQRLEREVSPPVHAGLSLDSAARASSAQVILKTKVDALDITVLKGGGPAVVAWVKANGFAVSPDAPTALDFYARRSPIFLAATYDPAAAQARGLTVGDGTPVQISIPLPNPWVPLRILALGKDPDDVVQADVFLLTDHSPSILTGPGVSLTRSEPASPSLLSDLHSDHGMGWVPDTSWLSHLKIQAPAGQLRYDMAIDASGVGHPSAVAAGLLSVRLARTLPSGSWTGWDIAGAAALALLVVFFAEVARRRSRKLLS
jgi:uncharacterized protein DUF2330